MRMAVKKKSVSSNTKSEKTECLFSKEQLLSAERFKGRKDIVDAVLSAGEKYTVQAVEDLIQKYMKGQVK